MRSSSSSALAILAAAALQGCSLSPSSADFGEYFQSDRIANRNSCEFREELIDLTASLVEDAGLAETIRKDPKALFSNIDRFRPETRDLIERFRTATVAYSYTFTTTENNNISGNALVGFPYVPLNLKFNAQNDRSRQTIDRFTTSDNWYDLFEDKVVLERCKGFVPANRNFAYPLTGKIGLREPIKSFFDLVQVGALSGDQANLAAKTVSFDFLTRLVGRVDPSVELVRFGGSPQFVSASGSAEVRREDRHQVSITMAIPKSAPKSAPKTVAVRAARKDSEAKAVFENKRVEDLEAFGAFGRR